jgi:hypothetical protein
MEEKGFRRRLQLLWENTVNWALNRPLDFLFLQQFGHSPYRSLLNQDESSNHYAFFHELIETGRRSDQLRELPTRLMYELCTHHLYGTINYLRQHPEEQRKPAVMKAAFECHFRSISLS